MTIYNPSKWHWIVAGDGSRVWSSAARAYLPTSDLGYQAWLAAGNLPSRIASEAELWEVLALQAPEFLPAAVQDVLKKIQVDKLDLVQMQIAFNHENRIRALEGKAPLTASQFRDAIKALL